MIPASQAAAARAGQKDTSRFREQAAASVRWQPLAAKGAASLQRLLWASTGVKDKAFPTTRYVTELVSPNTVNTMPEATLKAVGDYRHATPDMVRGKYPEARTILQSLARVGIDISAVADALEHQGIAAFVQSWDDLIGSVEEQLKKVGAEVTPAGAVTPPARGRAKPQGRTDRCGVGRSNGVSHLQTPSSASPSIGRRLADEIFGIVGHRTDGRRNG
jgi:transaldolase